MGTSPTRLGHIGPSNACPRVAPETTPLWRLFQQSSLSLSLCSRHFDQKIDQFCETSFVSIKLVKKIRSGFIHFWGPILRSREPHVEICSLEVRQPGLRAENASFHRHDSVHLRRNQNWRRNSRMRDAARSCAVLVLLACHASLADGTWSQMSAPSCFVVI